MTCTRHQIRTVGPWVLVAALVVGLGGTAGATFWRADDTVRYVESATAAADRQVAGLYADIVDAVTPAVVRVTTSQLRTGVVSPFDFGEPFWSPFFRDGQSPFGRTPRAPETFRRHGVGSGVIVSPDGYILTNHHVVDGADTVSVALTDQRQFEATIVGSDPATDLAVLRIEAADVPALPLGDSDAVRVGDVVLAIGEPLGLGQSVTMGIISAKSRTTDLGDGAYQDFLQTDAPINQGNSGGALVNVAGELIGVNSQILSPSGGNIGIGFAVPSNMARHVMDQLVAFGEVRRGRLGVTIQDVTSDLARSLGLPGTRGVIVSSVEEDSPAARAGLQQRDVIVAFDGTPVEDGNRLRNLVAATAPDSEVTTTVVRDGEERMLDVTLGAVDRALGAEAGDPTQEGTLGMTVEPLSPERARRMGIEETEGLLVTGVDSAGAANRAGIRRGDVITQVDGTRLATVAALRESLASADDRPALVLVERNGQALFVALGPVAG